MIKKKIKIGDIIRIKGWDSENHYFKIEAENQIINTVPVFIVSKVPEIKKDETFTVDQHSCIRILGYKAVKLFNNDKDLLRYLKIYDWKIK